MASQLLLGTDKQLEGLGICTLVFRVPPEAPKLDRQLFQPLNNILGENAYGDKTPRTAKGSGIPYTPSEHGYISLYLQVCTMALLNPGIQVVGATEKLYPSGSNNASSVDIDDLELEAVGYRRQMPRQFSVFSLMSLSFALTCTWSGTGASMGVSLTEASSAGTIWSLPVAGQCPALFLPS